MFMFHAMEGQRNSVVLSDQTARLEVERARMEERLKMLKRVMSVEKSQRGSSGTDSYWKSSKRGPLTRLNPPIAQDSEETKKPLKVKLLTGGDVKSGKSDSHTLCGQCNLYRASMVCMECTENFCTACFTKIHQKGALLKHHIRPLASGSVKERKEKSKKTSDSNSPNHSTLSEDPLNNNSSSEALKGRSLLEGMYDEAASAAAFQEALAEWRRGGKDDACQVSPSKDKEVITASSCGVQANSVNDLSMAPLTISFTASSPASYLEKLLLKKVRKNQALPFRHKQFSENNTSITEPDDEDPVSYAPSIYNVFYNAEEDLDAQEQDMMADLDQTTPAVLSNEEEVTVVSANDVEVTVGSKLLAPGKESPQPSAPHTTGSGSSQPLKSPATESGITTSSQPSAQNAIESSNTIDTAVILAWEECSTAPLPPSLTSTFLSSVNTTDTDKQQDVIVEPNDSHVTEQRFTLGSALWRPNSSIAVPDDIHPADLPPQAPSPVLLLAEETKSSLDLSCQDEREEDWEGEEDNRAIDELEWELASTIDGGRETRAALLEEEEEDDTTLWSHVSTQQLMEDFEHYQEKMKEQEDDTV